MLFWILCVRDTMCMRKLWLTFFVGVRELYLFGVDTVLPKRPFDHFRQHHRGAYNVWQKDLWVMIWCATTLTLWNRRNVSC